MSNVIFKYPQGLKAKCKVTNFTGTITARSQQINGSVQYALQPAAKEGESFIPDGLIIDEENIQLLDALPEGWKPESVNFTFETGDQVRNRLNNFEGFISRRVQHQNGCEGYRVEGPITKEGKEVNHPAYLQELVAIGKGMNALAEEPVQRKRTGGPMVRERLIEKA